MSNFNYLGRLEEPERDPGESVGGGAAEAEVHQELRRVHLAGEQDAVHAARIEWDRNTVFS